MKTTKYCAAGVKVLTQVSLDTTPEKLFLAPLDKTPQNSYKTWSLVGCLRYTKFCWVGKNINIFMKPTNAPTQGQPNPRKIRFNSGNWVTFSHSK